MQELGYLGHILNPLAEGRERSNKPPACIAAYEQRKNRISSPLAALRSGEVYGLCVDLAIAVSE